MIKNSFSFILLIACVFIDKGYSQNWTYYVRTSGHGCAINQLHAVMDDARQTHLFGIEVDNDITGRYNSFLNPEAKLQAIKAMADSAHAVKNYAFGPVPGIPETIPVIGAEPKQ